MKFKTQEVSVSNPEHTYEILNSRIEHMTLNKTIREKNLGVKVDNKLNFSNHTEIQVNKANRILHQIKRSYDIFDLCGTCKANP